MQKIIMAGIFLACAVSVSGCNPAQQTEIDNAISALNADVSAAQATLPKIASTKAQACAKIMPSVGYLNDAIATGLVPVNFVAYGNDGVAVIEAICNSTVPTTLTDVVADLGKAWAVVQAATHKTGT